MSDSNESQQNKRTPREVNRRLKVGDIVKIAAYFQRREIDFTERPWSSDELEKIVEKELGIKGNGPTLREIADQAGISIPNSRSGGRHTSTESKRKLQEDIARLQDAVLTLSESMVTVLDALNESNHYSTVTNPQLSRLTKRCKNIAESSHK